MQWIVLGAASVTAVLVGVHRNRPARVGPWLLLSGALASLAVGDVCYALGETASADLSYAIMFPLLALSLLQLTRGGAILVDRARLIDLLAFTCSVLLVVWVFVLGGAGDVGAISAPDVLGDLLLIAVATRLTVAAWRNWSALLLLVGALGLLAADLTYPLTPGPLAETGYTILYVSWGAAALHPSMTRLTAPHQARPTPWRGRWAALLAVSVATPPAVLLIEAVTTGVTDGVVIAAASVITVVLTFTRLADSLNQHSAALTRERGLREASAALVAAADLPAVDDAVRAAVHQLLPDGVHRITFATDDRQLAIAAPPVVDDHRRLALTAAPGGDDRRPAIVEDDRRRAPGGSERRPGSAAVGHRERSWWLPDPAAADGEATLVCPLWLEPLAVARPSGGALVLTGARDSLGPARDTLEVLAGQAALALDRISLVDAVGRRDSDLYLRAVIRNTADAMLVIDSDQHIRYASPAVRRLVGVTELTPLATLHDLVHPDDRAQVRDALRADGDGVVFCALLRPDGTQVFVEATYRDLREDRLVQGFVVTMRDVTDGHEPGERLPRLDHVGELPARVNRRSAQHKFRY
ncbi:PAS domain S-box-containing protein [Krasilnikovia cinnamomea]|uniref:PAS domain S-box-containing protein n=1 Tax=Krasilnikovia cinnamomea TaxID=349313 RepID=A0A4V2G7H2_9ACTN|nr:PAS domain S-box-containing protein [Krasilnikovia cinnamomea]